jgi:hypothetical protein
LVAIDELVPFRGPTESKQGLFQRIPPVVALYRVLKSATNRLQQETTEVFPATVAAVSLEKSCNEMGVLCNERCNEDFHPCNGPWGAIRVKNGLWLQILAFSLQAYFMNARGR